jgi:hypothetical protein
MEPMRIFVTALLVSGTLLVPAFGDDAKSALKEFGLIGTWSPDCSIEPSQPRASRVTFAAPSVGGATATVHENRDGALIDTVDDLIESSMIDGDKIGITFHPVTITRSDGKPASQHAYDNMHVVFQKAGERIQAIRIQFEGLPEVQRDAFFEKCPN